MAVEIDSGSVQRAVHRQEGEVWVALRASGGPAADGALAEVVTELNEAEGPEGIFAELVSTTPQGAATMVSVPEGSDAAAWVEAVGQRLDRRGVSGTLAAARSASYPRWTAAGARPDSLTAYVLWSLDRAAMAANEDRDCAQSWYLDETTTDRICETVAAWGAAGGDEAVVGSSFQVTLAAAADISEVLATGVRRDDRVSALWHQRSPQRARRVMLTPGARSVFEVLPRDLPWTDRLAALRSVLTAHPDLTELAFVRPSFALASTWLQIEVALPFPHIRERDLRYNRHLLDRWVPDAHGVQVLTDAHLERADDLAAWSVTDLGAGRHLVQARDLEAWYGDDLPQPEVLAQARRDFGGMVLTPDVIAANPFLPPRR